jgi:hypothetical protein
MVADMDEQSVTILSIACQKASSSELAAVKRRVNQGIPLSLKPGKALKGKAEKFKLNSL